VPEIHRESLVPLVLTAAAWGKTVEQLPLLDPPKPYALAAARAELQAWGALQGDNLSAQGRDLFAIPIEPAHAQLLAQARNEQCVDDMLDLVSVLSVGRPMFTQDATSVSVDADLRLGGCDATAAIRALRASRAEEHGASSFVVREARSTRARLRRLLGLPPLEVNGATQPIAREALVRAALAADPRLAHVARTRGRTVYFSNGGTEIELARESAVNNLKEIDAILALDTRAFGAGREARILVTCALPVGLPELLRAGLGVDQRLGVRLERQRVMASVERSYAGRVLSTREEPPSGEALHTALVELLLRGSMFREAVATTRERLLRTALAAWLEARGRPSGAGTEPVSPSLEAWLLARVVELGVQQPEDVMLLSRTDFLAPELSFEIRSAIETDYPLTVGIGDATYRAEYDLDRNQVTLHMTKGTRKEPPPLGYLPKFPGLRIQVDSPRGISVLRARG
jgi:HrpA-like RNA helicase